MTIAIFFFGLVLIAQAVAVEEDDPMWGCGLLGQLPGISKDGTVAPETQRLIDGVKGSSSFNMVSYWNWDLAPRVSYGGPQFLSKDFLFMPEVWGPNVVMGQHLRPAGETNYLDGNGIVSPSTMATLLLGMNEPDIQGSCMGNLFGKCTKPCSIQRAQAGTCPVGYLDPFAGDYPVPDGECNCWQFSYATGAGFWPLVGCPASDQPLPQLWDYPQCVDIVFENWEETAAIAASKGYKYLTTPLVAVDLGYAKKFIERACAACHDISCGCPVYVGFHFYALDCQPETLGGYDEFSKKLAEATAIMEEFTFIKGVIINEVGMLNCLTTHDNPICIPDSGKYPASKQPDHSCPKTDELPNGMATFMERLFDLVIAAKTKDGRAVVKGFSWFQEDQDGGTYNLQLWNPDGSLNDLGEAYIHGCTRWSTGELSNTTTAGPTTASVTTKSTTTVTRTTTSVTRTTATVTGTGGETTTTGVDTTTTTTGDQYGWIWDAVAWIISFVQKASGDYPVLFWIGVVVIAASLIAALRVQPKETFVTFAVLFLVALIMSSDNKLIAVCCVLCILVFMYVERRLHVRDVRAIEHRRRNESLLSQDQAAEAPVLSA